MTHYNGGWYFVPSALLRAPARCRVRTTSAGHDLGRKVVYWFVNSGLCSKAHGDEVVAQLFARAR